jgi:hypothetical protein
MMRKIASLLTMKLKMMTRALPQVAAEALRWLKIAMKRKRRRMMKKMS